MAPVIPIVGAATEGASPPSVQHYLRPGTLQLASLPPLSLYVHIPWCLKKCPYCDFNSHEAHGAPPEARYIAALKNRISHRATATAQLCGFLREVWRL